ncbi:MAG TPA: hypothetical protein V6C97_16245 [Oculatellaceae cyanobacterium]
MENGGAIRPASERNGEERVLDSGVKVAAYKAPTARVRKTPDGKDPAAPRRPWAAQSFYVPERSRELRILKPSWTAKQIQKVRYNTSIAFRSYLVICVTDVKLNVVCVVIVSLYLAASTRRLQEAAR